MKTPIKRLTLVLGATLAGLIVAEAALRLHNPFLLTGPLTPAYSAPCFEPGTYYWFRLKKNASCILRSNFGAFPDVAIRTNALHLRNGPVIVPKPPNTIRILFIGDSFTMGWGVEDRQAYPKLVESLLQSDYPHKRIEAVNAGLVYTSMGYDYLFLKNQGLALAPDIVVIGFYPFNDIYDSFMGSVWTQTDAQGLPTQIASRQSFVDSGGTLTTRSLWSRPDWPLGDWELVKLTGLLVDSAVPSKPEIYERICIYKADCHDLDEAKARIKQLFGAIIKLTRTANARLLVVLTPAEFQVTRGVRFSKYKIPYTLTPQDKDRPYVEFGQFLQQQNVTTIDLRPAMIAQADSKLYFDLDDHWTSLGHAVAAQTIADQLKTLLSKP